MGIRNVIPSGAESAQKATRDDIPDPHEWSKPIFKPSAQGSPIPIVISSSSKACPSITKSRDFFCKSDFSASRQQDADFILTRRKAFHPFQEVDVEGVTGREKDSEKDSGTDIQVNRSRLEGEEKCDPFQEL